MMGDGMGGSSGGGMGLGSPGGPRHLLVRANSLRLPVASGSVHSCITSPPYYSLRSYSVSPTYWPAVSYAPMVNLPPVDVPAMSCCLGLEPSPESYIAHLILIFDEVWRVMRRDSVTFVNLGDCYNAYNGNRGKSTSFQENAEVAMPDLPGGYGLTAKGLKPLDLLGIPWRFAFAAQARGWTLRSAPPWVKPGSAMPESCTSRPNVSTEMIFMLTKTSNYYFDMCAVRRGHARQWVGGNNGANKIRELRGTVNSRGNDGLRETDPHPAGRHLRTSDFFLDSLDSAIAFHADRLAELEAVRAKGGLLGAEGGAVLPGAFLVNPQSYAGSHYAAWPTKLVADMVKASTSEAGVCGGCGSPYEREVEREGGVVCGYDVKSAATPAPDPSRARNGRDGSTLGNPGGNWEKNGARTRTLGWHPTCSCPEGTPRNRACVLDPFGGSGTTAQVATSLGRHAISVDLSKDYHQLASDRVDRPHKPLPRRPRPGRPTATLPGFGDDDE
jgi:hypothetical protein